jgi:hypothetical protein
MKIIFDSEEEKEDFMANLCPDDVLPAKLSDFCYGPCSECWKNCGIEMEVK